MILAVIAFFATWFELSAFVVGLWILLCEWKRHDSTSN